MPDKIIQLSETVSNMIAAGEVVERPSSVVKELVENSLDANSTYCEVNLLESGIQRIEIRDNGTGMSKNDLYMAFQRHATSKIKNEFDLFRLSTLGFRGEAIPSIASVSEMTIQSNDGVDNQGHLVTIKASKKIEDRDVAMNQGTIITVSKLFYNTPARLKYLKSPSSELASIVDLMDHLALSRPDVYFKLTNNGKVILQTNGKNDLLSVIYSVYGNEISKNMISIHSEREGLKLHGYISNMNVNRSRKYQMSFIVNGRIVKNNALYTSVLEGYETYIPIGKFPIVVLYIDLDPYLIDVNIHPSKAIIKFSNEQLISDFISHSILETLRKVNHVQYENIQSSNMKSNQKFVQEEIRLFNEEPVSKNSFSQNIPFPTTEEKQDETLRENKEKTPIHMEVPKNPEKFNETIHQEPTQSKGYPFLEYIGQYRGTYLLFQSEDALYLMDQHAAMERIRYEYYCKKLLTLDGATQPLLIPYNLELTKSETMFLEEHMEEIRSFGIDMEPSGEKSFYLRGVPLWMIEDDLEGTTEMVLSYLFEHNTLDIQKIREDLSKMMACKSSVKANTFLSKIEAEKLIIDLNQCENPFTCPHGRPVAIKMTNYELEKMFKRVI